MTGHTFLSRDGAGSSSAAVGEIGMWRGVCSGRGGVVVENCLSVGLPEGFDNISDWSVLAT